VKTGGTLPYGQLSGAIGSGVRRLRFYRHPVFPLAPVWLLAISYMPEALASVMRITCSLPSSDWGWKAGRRVAVRIKSDKRCEVLLRISKLSFQDELKS
jgi:hypothetical protein